MTNSYDRASRVCDRCKIRKRACDKRIPSCGYCSSRGLTCSYVQGLTTNVTSIRKPQILGSLTLDTDINNQVNNILASVGLTSQHVEEHYFRALHSSLPIIRPRFPNPGSAETALLLLAMTIVSQNLPTADVIYSSLRRLYVLVEESRDESITLLQTKLLVAAYEYSRGWIQKAYVSIGTCVSLSNLLHIDQEASAVKDRGHESWNLWWGVLILKSIIISELPATITHFPEFENENIPLPTDSVDSPTSSMSRIEQIPSTVSQVNPRNIGDFGRQAQAAFLLHKAIQFIRYPPYNLIEAGSLDRQVKTLLTFLMDENNQSLVSRDSSIPITVRSLFILHENLLIERRDEATDEEIAWSQETLSTLITIFTDVARHHQGDHHFHHALPLCCAENIRSVRRHITHASIGKDEKGVDALDSLEAAFSSLWRCGNSL